MSERPRPPGMDPTTWRFQNMGEAIVRREVEIQRLRGLVARLEWNRDGRCNGCNGFQWTGGHEPGCEVAAELRTERPSE